MSDGEFVNIRAFQIIAQEKQEAYAEQRRLNAARVNSYYQSRYGSGIVKGK